MEMCHLLEPYHIYMVVKVSEDRWTEYCNFGIKSGLAELDFLARLVYHIHRIWVWGCTGICD
jgi:hypothetical protein